MPCLRPRAAQPVALDTPSRRQAFAQPRASIQESGARGGSGGGGVARARMMAHTTWLRRGCADEPGSPFHVLRLDESERSVSSECKCRAMNDSLHLSSTWSMARQCCGGCLHAQQLQAFCCMTECMPGIDACVHACMHTTHDTRGARPCIMDMPFAA
eukprot:365325-Chlamydomonas_euryale.AAC.20